LSARSHSPGTHAGRHDWMIDEPIIQRAKQTLERAAMITARGK